MSGRLGGILQTPPKFLSPHDPPQNHTHVGQSRYSRQLSSYGIHLELDVASLFARSLSLASSGLWANGIWLVYWCFAHLSFVRFEELTSQLESSALLPLRMSSF